MASALNHQQNGNGTLALAFWENVLRLLPDEIPIHNEILEECCRIVQVDEYREPIEEPTHPKVRSLLNSYQKERSEEKQESSERIYRAMCQQCGENYALALVYWKNVLKVFPMDSLLVTLAVQDFCWIAHQYLTARKTTKCIDLYKQLLRTFPEFLEGYLNLSLILFKSGLIDEILPLFEHIPASCREEFIVHRYKDLYHTIEAISKQFEQVPYAAIESIVNDLRIENTFYPVLHEEYFTEIVTELVEREKWFFEKRRKALEEKAIARTSKQLADEGTALGQRVTMAKQATFEEIPKFLYDNSIRIAEVLLNHPGLTADDVLVMAQTSHVSEILSLITRSRKWGTIHAIRMAILLNPQTFPKDSTQLLQLLRLNDLATVVHKNTIPTEVRIRAKQRIQDVFNRLSMHEKFAVVESSSGNLLKLIDRINFDLSSFIVNLIGKFYEDPEIITQLCLWKLTPASILAMIGKNSEFNSNIQIIFALLSNPRTPPVTITSVAQYMSGKDLRDLMLNPRIPPSVKQIIFTAFPKTLD